jgi:formylmethanofuran dehydrogenase subunit A
MLKISGGIIYDPANGIDGQVQDLWIQDGRIVAAPRMAESAATQVIDASGYVIMPGGIDMHCHIAGPKVNSGRKLTPEMARRGRMFHRTEITRSGTVGPGSARP